MGKLMSRIQEVIHDLHLTPSKLLMVGLDSAGKTTILYKIRLNEEDVRTVPTVGFNVETVTVCKNVTFTIWDIGGQEKLRHLWNFFFKGSHGILFVVDSSDAERIPDARDELMRMCKSPELVGVPLVVIVNKQDVNGALTMPQMREALQLGRIKDRLWCIQETCAIKGDGLVEAMSKMAGLVKTFKKSGHKRNKALIKL